MKAIMMSACLLVWRRLHWRAPPVPPTPAPVDEVVYARPFSPE